MQRLTFAFFPDYPSKNNTIALEIRILVSAPGRRPPTKTLPPIGPQGIYSRDQGKNPYKQ